jgi:enoyl-[acyl-carrier-protein] reductase (NADH)
MGGLLEGKKVLVTGVLDRRSIALAASAAPDVSPSERLNASTLNPSFSNWM